MFNSIFKLLKLSGYFLFCIYSLMGDIYLALYATNSDSVSMEDYPLE